MSTSALEPESATLRSLREDFVARGYRFTAPPSADETPAFLDGYIPDAVAIGDHDRVIIDIKGRKPRKSTISLDEIARRVPRTAPWRYLLVYEGQDPDAIASLPRPSKQQVDAALAEASALLQEGHSQAATLAAWSILEALARRIQPDDIRFSVPPLSPAQTIERLAMEGELGPDEASKLRSLRSLRNAIVHGDLDARMSREDAAYILSVAEAINARLATD